MWGTSLGKLHLLIVNAESEIDPKICYLQAVEVKIYFISAYLLHDGSTSLREKQA